MAGGAWVVFAWLAWGDTINSADSRYIDQARSAAEDVPDWLAISVGLVFIYLIGLVSATGVRPIARAVQLVWVAVEVRIAWRRHVHERYRNQKRDSKRFADRVEQARQQHAAAEMPDEQLQNHVRVAEQAQLQLDGMKSEVGWWRLVPQSEANVKLFGQARSDRAYAVAEELLGAAYERGVRQQLSGSATPVGVGEVPSEYFDTSRFVAEVEPDPLDILHAKDVPFYQNLDREQAEREFRVQVGAPAIAIAIYSAVQITPLAWIVVGLASLMFISSAARLDQSVRVLKYLAYIDASPALQDAALNGRDAARARIHQVAS